MFGHGLDNPVWASEDGRIVAGTLPDGSLIIKTQTKPDDETYLVDTLPIAKQEIA
jgi:hypothetical protein